ncbi:MAG: proline--tRNA ligase [Candidatus Shapirobacteria bacterium]|jgi:prolyl-tRNA synthetase
MLYSQLFGKATKSVVRDATAASHRYLLQAGFIRPLAAGRYTLLPLGLRVARKIEKIIREEVEKTGAQELIVPTLHPIEIWRQAKRDQKFGASMMRVTDRNGSEFTLGATAEVIMMDLVNQLNPTYKDLPINIYQFSQKFRDEARPSGGLLRVREFVMKDAYSFHCDEADLKITYEKYRQSYLNIAHRLGLEVTIVESDNGAIGGSISHEFMVESEVGEDTIVKCVCGYAANLETASTVYTPVNLDEPQNPMQIINQPAWVETMEDNIKHYKKAKEYYLKNVVYKDSDGQLVIAVIRGDLAVNKAKLAKVYGAKGDLEPATEEDLKKMGTKPGWVHCWGHKAVYVGDLSLKTVHNFIGGQKEEDTDSINVNYGRDFTCELEGDIAEVKEGSKCPRCQKNSLVFKKAVEFGNIFNIGYTYSQPMNGNFVGQDGQLKSLYMGSYGIGIGRAMACVVELHHDEQGIQWPVAIAPYHVHLVGLNLDVQSVNQSAQSLYQQLASAGIEVLYDDRPDISAGSKFADADLIGLPYRLVISSKSLESGGTEIKNRTDGKMEIISLDQTAKHLKNGLISF